MELNWSTFVLEIINFLVLVWILKRFLYKPVLDVIAARRKAIEDQLSQSKSLREEAEALKQQYTGRLSDWEEEKRQTREALAREIEQERARKLANMQSDIELEQKKAQVAEARRQTEARLSIERLALAQGAAFSSRLLGQAAGPELEDRLLNLVIEGLTRLSQDRLGQLRERWGDASRPIDVESAFTLSDSQRQRLSDAIRTIVGPSATLRFERDKALVAGLRVVIGAWVLAANVRDELRGFAELADAAD